MFAPLVHIHQLVIVGAIPAKLHIEMISIYSYLLSQQYAIVYCLCLYYIISLHLSIYSYLLSKIGFNLNQFALLVILMILESHLMAFRQKHTHIS